MSKGVLAERVQVVLDEAQDACHQALDELAQRSTKRIDEAYRLGVRDGERQVVARCAKWMTAILGIAIVLHGLAYLLTGAYCR